MPGTIFKERNLFSANDSTFNRVLRKPLGRFVLIYNKKKENVKSIKSVFIKYNIIYFITYEYTYTQIRSHVPCNLYRLKYLVSVALW